jgi:hypothetical protein
MTLPSRRQVSSCYKLVAQLTDMAELVSSLACLRNFGRYIQRDASNTSGESLRYTYKPLLQTIE